MGSVLCPPGFSFPTRGTVAQGRPLCTVLHWPGGGAKWSSVAAFLFLLMQAVLVSVVQRMLTLCIRILLVVSCSPAVLSYSCKGEQSQE